MQSTMEPARENERTRNPELQGKHGNATWTLKLPIKMGYHPIFLGVKPIFKGILSVHPLLFGLVERDTDRKPILFSAVQ